MNQETVKCQACGTENHTKEKFCGNCGVPLFLPNQKVKCLNCGDESPITKNFCGNCGTPLRETEINVSHNIPLSMPPEFKTELEIMLYQTEKVVGWFPKLTCTYYTIPKPDGSINSDSYYDGLVITSNRLLFLKKMMLGFGSPQIRTLPRTSILSVTQKGNLINIAEVQGQWNFGTNARQANEIAHILA